MTCQSPFQPKLFNSGLCLSSSCLPMWVPSGHLSSLYETVSAGVMNSKAHILIILHKNDEIPSK